jgi:hypothetical protein
VLVHDKVRELVGIVVVHEEVHVRAGEPESPGGEWLPKALTSINGGGGTPPSIASGGRGSTRAVIESGA